MDIELFLEKMFQVVLYMSIVPIGVGIYCWAYLNWPLRIFWLSLVVGLLISLIGDYLMAKHINNHVMFYVNTATDAVLMTAFFSAFMPSPFLQKLYQWLCVGLLFFMGWGIWTWGSSLNTALRLSSIESCVVISMALLVLTNQLRQSTAVSLRRQPVVYIVVGVLVLNLFTLLLNLFGSQLYTYSARLFNLFYDTLAPLSNLLSYIFTCIGFWQSRSRALPLG